jgi:hypothetical protein
VFQYTGEKFTTEANFWSLMWVMLAIGIGAGYFMMGYVSTHVAAVCLRLTVHKETVINSDVVYLRCIPPAILRSDPLPEDIFF